MDERRDGEFLDVEQPAIAGSLIQVSAGDCPAFAPPHAHYDCGLGSISRLKAIGATVQVPPHAHYDCGLGSPRL